MRTQSVRNRVGESTTFSAVKNPSGSVAREIPSRRVPGETLMPPITDTQYARPDRLHN